MSVVERALDKLRGGSSEMPRMPGPAMSPGDINALVDGAQGAVSNHRIAIDVAALRAAGYLPEEDQDRRLADECRHIKRPLLASAFAADGASRHPSPRLVMMASALPGDGKTFTSINLALSIAKEKDFSVVLVDADVAKPHVSRFFGVDDQPGLLDAIADPAIDVGSLILPTDVPGFSILPAGKGREHGAELLSSGRMGEVASRMLRRDPRCLVLFDSPPLIASSESRALAGAAGHVVLVVRAGHTPCSAVTEAIEVLGPVKPVSLVLNQGRRSRLDGRYGYVYGSYGDAKAE
jgi:exopolysaccharide/PEP-CTERM locus tyrosine autokinase